MQLSTSLAARPAWTQTQTEAGSRCAGAPEPFTPSDFTLPELLQLLGLETHLKSFMMQDIDFDALRLLSEVMCVCNFSLLL